MIETRGLTKKYGNVLALRSLDLAVPEGTIFGFVGPNGAGKTTTIRILCGLLAPSGGSATVAGVDVVAHPEKLGAQVGYMPDFLIPYDGMRVWEYLDFFGAAYRLPRAKRRQRIDEVIDLTGIGAMRDYYVETLSHGMRQRLGIARTLVHDPTVLFLDEPTGGLDPRARVEIRVLLARLKQLGKTIVVSSHILPELATFCDQVGFIDQGVLKALGTVREVARQVHSNRVFEIEVVNHPEKAASDVSELLPPEHLVRFDRLANLLRVEMKGSDPEIALLLTGLVERGHAIIGFREVTADLEEAFLALTSGDEFGRRSEAQGRDHRNQDTALGVARSGEC